MTRILSAAASETIKTMKIDDSTHRGTMASYTATSVRQLLIESDTTTTSHPGDPSDSSTTTCRSSTHVSPSRLELNIRLLHIFIFLTGLSFLSPVFVIYLKENLHESTTCVSSIIAAQAITIVALEVRHTHTYTRTDARARDQKRVNLVAVMQVC